jgi:hypothetical protein
MGAFLRGKGQILWDVTVDTGYVQPMDFLAPGSRDWFVLTVKIRQPSHEFTFGVGMSFIPYPLVLTPVV